VQQVAPKRSQEFLRAPVLESDLVVNASVVYQRLDPAELRRGLVHCVFATLSGRQIHTNHVYLATIRLEFRLKLPASSSIAIYSYGNGALLSAGFAYGLTNALSAARYQHNLILDVEIHGERAIGRTNAQPRRLKKPPSIG
jgi:hypothetical protein